MTKYYTVIGVHNLSAEEKNQNLGRQNSLIRQKEWRAVTSQNSKFQAESKT